MLKLSAFEFLVRSVPEVLIFMFAIYSFSQTRLNVKRYLLASFLMGICVFLIRALPINYGVHTILNIIMLTVIACSINKIDKIKAIRSSIIMTIALFVCEGINVAALSLIYGPELERIFENSSKKTIYGLPSLIAFGIIVMVYYLYLKKKDKLSYV